MHYGFLVVIDTRIIYLLFLPFAIICIWLNNFHFFLGPSSNHCNPSVKSSLFATYSEQLLKELTVCYSQLDISMSDTKMPDANEHERPESRGPENAPDLHTDPNAVKPMPSHEEEVISLPFYFLHIF